MRVGREQLVNLARTKNFADTSSRTSPEKRSPFDAEYRDRHSLPVSSTLHAELKELVESGIVTDDRESGAYALADPFFGRYVM